MPRLETSTDSLPSYLSTFTSLFSTQSLQPRREIARSLLLRSVRLRVVKDGGAWDDQERLEGFQRGTLPLRVRPAFVLLNVLCLLCLAILGFHPRGQTYVPINDKILHFICFLFATGLFYFIWDVDEPARRVWIWRNMSLILTWIICFAAGGFGSEFVQSLLPYKTFQWGDVLANLIGSGVGLFFSFHAEKRYRTRREIERLYEPLDQDLYDDDEEAGDEQEREEEEAAGGGGMNAWRSIQQNRDSNGKKVHFGDNSVVPQETPVQKDDLFRIDDDDDHEGGDVWRSASD